MKVIAIAAVGKNGVIGKENGLPWDIPEDMRFFRESTREQVVVMGRKTYDSLGKALPKRENGVITRDPNWKRDDVHVFHRLEDAVAHFKNDEKLAEKNVFVIGGAEIYTLALPLLDEVWLTEIDAEFSGDAFFPGYRDGRFLDPSFQLRESRPQKEVSNPPYSYRFNFYSRTV